MKPNSSRRLSGRGLILLVIALTSQLTAPAASAATPTDLFFSEYVEGGPTFAKAVEIFNGTNSPIDLGVGGYAIDAYANGASAPTGTIALTGSVGFGDVFVVANPGSDPIVLAAADLQSAGLNVNGNDALVLRKGGTVLDVIGQVGFDPGAGGWGTDPTNTVDNTIRRKSSVTAGDSNGGDAFDPAAEWDGFPDGTFDGLGAHAVVIGGESGGVTLEVAVEPEAEPCLVIDASAIDFGTLAFSTEAEISSASRNVTATSCSTGPEEIFAAGTDAAGDGVPAAAWALSSVGGNPCATGFDAYGVALTADLGAGPMPPLRLSAANSSWLELDAEASAATTVDYQMPCEGSSGAGQTMTSQITFLATAP
jgi:uncharacterized protein